MALCNLGCHLLILFPCSLYSNHVGSYCFWDTQISLLPQVPCTCCFLWWDCFPPDNLLIWFPDLFHSLLRCHLLSESFPAILLKMTPTSALLASSPALFFSSVLLPSAVLCIYLFGWLIAIHHFTKIWAIPGEGLIPCSIPWAENKQCSAQSSQSMKNVLSE